MQTFGRIELEPNSAGKRERERERDMGERKFVHELLFIFFSSFRFLFFFNSYIPSKIEFPFFFVSSLA